MSCSDRGDICFFGSDKTTSLDYEHIYWQSVDNKKSKASEKDIQKCNQEAETARITLVNICTELCSDGHISKEDLPYAISIQHNYIKNTYKKLTGTTDQILIKFCAMNSDDYPNFDKLPSVDTLGKACARYIPKDGILYDYEGIGPDIKFYTDYYFEQCMSTNNFEKIIPKKTEKYCKMPMW